VVESSLARPRDDLLLGGVGRCRDRPWVGPKPAPVDRLGRVPGRLAQLGERRLDKAEVGGSSPSSPTVKSPANAGFFHVYGLIQTRRASPLPLCCPCKPRANAPPLTNAKPRGGQGKGSGCASP
jgi:hypothetical protein